MYIEVQHPEFMTQRLTVETAGFLRGPRLLVNGVVAKKKKGRYTVTSDSGAEISIQLKYNYLDPIPKLKIGDNITVLASPIKWYEYVWMDIPIILVFSGGAIGGLVGAVAANASGKIFRSQRSSPVKYGLSALITLGAFIVFVVFATVFQLLVGSSHK